MKFGHEYSAMLASQGFPQHWLESAIEYKYLKKCIKNVHNDLQSIGLDTETLKRLSEWVEEPQPEETKAQHKHGGYYSAAEPGLSSIPEEFSPQLTVLVDSQTDTPLDAALAPETKKKLQKLAMSELVIAGRHAELGHTTHSVTNNQLYRLDSAVTVASLEEQRIKDTRRIQIPLASAKDFFDLLGPKLEELEALNRAEGKELEQKILDLGDAVANVTEPVREGFEAKRKISYRDLYFWREMFRLYMDKPIFYSETERNRGALTFNEAKARLQVYDEQLRSTGLLAKMRTPLAKAAAKQFLDLNVNILRIMHFQEMNARAMTKILKKFNKHTHLGGKPLIENLQTCYPALLTSKQNAAGGFASSIARDLHAEISTKVLAIVPQLDDWNCPVCYALAWRPVNLGCCRSVFCIRCIIKLQDEGMKRCPCCNKETVMSADGKNLDLDAMDFLEKYFPLEVKRRQKENEKANLVREYGEGFVKPGCEVM